MDKRSKDFLLRNLDDLKKDKGKKMKNLQGRFRKQTVLPVIIISVVQMDTEQSKRETA